MTTYTVHCEWDPTGWWAVTVPAIPGAITQSRRLDQVHDDAAEIIELMTGEIPEADEIELTWSLPGEAGAVANDARELRNQAADISERANELTRDAVNALHHAGFPLRDIGTLTGMSYQRAQQITSDGRARKARSKKARQDA